MNEQPRTLLFKSVRLIDPKSNHDAETCVLVKDGVVDQIAPQITAQVDRVIEGRGLWLTPGFVDLHAHLREPGEEYKEDIASGSKTAVQSGFTTVCAMPNTKPANDCSPVNEFILARGKEAGYAKILTIGAISKGLKGERLSDIGDLKQGGCVALSDDGRCVMNARLMRRALEYAKTFDLPVVQHAEDENLVDDGSMNEGLLSAKLGIKGRPACAETMIVARDIELVALIGTRYHVAHISTKGAIEFVREAKQRGLPVTCEVTPHHITLTEDACIEYDTAAKVNPPLRHKDDKEALIEALADGTIDCLATDHAPHSSIEKEVEFDCASPGMLGFQTALPLMLNLVRNNQIDIMSAIDRLTWGAAKCFGLDCGTVTTGKSADLVLIDPDLQWQLSADDFDSKSANSPFMGKTFKGRAVMTLVDGKVKYELNHEQR